MWGSVGKCGGRASKEGIGSGRVGSLMGGRFHTWSTHSAAAPSAPRRSASCSSLPGASTCKVAGRGDARRLAGLMSAGLEPSQRQSCFRTLLVQTRQQNRPFPHPISSVYSVTPSSVSGPHPPHPPHLDLVCEAPPDRRRHVLSARGAPHDHNEAIRLDRRPRPGRRRTRHSPKERFRRIGGGGGNAVRRRRPLVP